MAKLQKVLVAYDGSPHSKEALHWAVYFSRHSGVSVTAVNVFEPIMTYPSQEEGALALDSFAEYEKLKNSNQKSMAEVKEFGHTHGVDITTEVLTGKVAETLIDYAQKNAIDLIITGNRGRGTLKQLLVGSVTRHLVSRSPVPVLVVKHCPVVEFVGGSLIMTTLRNILVAYDGSPHSKEALAWAIEMARPVNAHVTVLKVREPHELSRVYSMAESGSRSKLIAALKAMENEEAAAMAEAKALGEKQGTAVTTLILEGNAAAILIEYAQKHGFDLVVAGARGHGILDRLPLGTVAHNLINVSTVPVLVVKA